MSDGDRLQAWLLAPFWSRTERRVRAGWRMLLTIGVLALLSGASQLGLALLWGDEAPGGLGRFSFGAVFVLGALASLVVIGGGARLLDRRPLDALGFRLDRRWWLDLGFGAALGGVLLFGVLAAEQAFGWARYSGVALLEGEVPRLAYVPVVVLVFAAVGFYEELVFRGYMLTNVAEGVRGRWVPRRAAIVLATILTSGIFGLAHALNPGASPIAVINIVMAGLMLAVGYVMTGELAIPIGLHFSWNLAQNLFGMPVSGQSNFHFAALLEREVTGPAWITGGAFGPEAGLTGLVAMAVGIALIGAWIRLRGGTLGVHPALASWEPPRGGSRSRCSSS